MNISGIDFESIVDGEGVRTVIFTSGCKHDCKGCHNPLTHDFNYGKDFSKAIQNDIIKWVKDTPYIAGITLSGGDPLYSCAKLLPFVLDFKLANPNKTIWLYTGFTFEQIKDNEDMMQLVKEVDVLVDGKFIEELKEFNLKFKGSTNQRIINIPVTLKYGSIKLFNE